MNEQDSDDLWVNKIRILQGVSTEDAVTRTDVISSATRKSSSSWKGVAMPYRRSVEAFRENQHFFAGEEIASARNHAAANHFVMEAEDKCKSIRFDPYMPRGITLALSLNPHLPFAQGLGPQDALLKWQA
jgi:hypothetical protein